MLSGSDFEKELAEWQQLMKAADEEAKKIPAAPPKAEFAAQLNKIDPTLLGRLPDNAEGNRDARSIVRKTGYLARMANTRPSIVLKYLISKCEVLFKYDLIPGREQVIDAAKQVRQLAEKGASPALTEATVALGKLLGGVNAAFREPLRLALLQFPDEVAKRKTV